MRVYELEPLGPTFQSITTFTPLPDTAFEGRPSKNPHKLLSALLLSSPLSKTVAFHVVKMFFEKY
jgi:hypothetical protein